MTPKIRALRDEIGRLQAELLDALQEQEAAVLYQLKTNIFRWLVTNRPQNLLTGPIIQSQ